MNRVTTVSASDITKTSIILYGRIEEKDHPLFGVGFLLIEGTSGNPIAGPIEPVGLIGGDVPICKFASTFINLKPNTRYRYRTIAYDPSADKITYLLNFSFPGCSIVGDKGLEFGETKFSFEYNAATKVSVINGIWAIDFSAGGIIETVIPPELGGDGTKSITYDVVLSGLPTTDLAGEMSIIKMSGEIFYGVTKSFRTRT